MVFFDNLLPESDARDLIAQAQHYDPMLAIPLRDRMTTPGGGGHDPGQ
jgi:hypothetical protein